MSFYMTLPSDSTTKTFPDSTQSKFKVKLPEQMRLLEDDWEVALASISLPDSHPYMDAEKIGDYPISLSVETTANLGSGQHKNDGK